MKRLLGLLALGLALIGAPALAANCSTYPYVLTNGQTADANQVMANFNSILSCANTNLLPSPLTNSAVITGLGYTPLDIAGTNAMTGILTLAPGTTTLSPLIIPTGVLNTTPTAGAIENNGTSFFGVNSSGTRKAFGYADGSNFTTAYAPLASPTFTGTPAAPTATSGTSTTQIATTAFVSTSFAPLASPALTGSPTAPTQTSTDNSTKIATTAFVQTVAGGSGGGCALAGTPTAGTNVSTVVGTNCAMVVTPTGAVTSWSVNFGGTWPTQAPICVGTFMTASPSTGVVLSFGAISRTAFTIDISTAAGAPVNILCLPA